MRTFPEPRDFGFAPRVALADGIARFVAWFADYQGYQKLR